MVKVSPVLRLNMSGCGQGPDRELEADRYLAAIDMAEFADESGFAIVNVEEHHDVEIGGRRAPIRRGTPTEDAARREARIEAEYDRLLHALHRCGPVVTAATLGIATRPYSGAWLAAALVERTRPWTARHDSRLALIREGLAAIERLGSREL